MTQERKLQFLMLSEIFKTTEEIPEGFDEAYNNMYEKYTELRSEFINEFNYPTTNTDPVKEK